MKIILIFTLMIIGFSSPAFATIDQLKGFLPDENSLSDDWQIGPITAKEDVDVDVTKETPDVVVRQYAITSLNETKQMIVTLSVFEFSTDSVAKNIHFQYESDLIKQNFEEMSISSDSNSNCIGFIKDRNQDTEGTSISCNKGPFLIISTVEQNGKIFADGVLISTAKMSASFAEFVLEKIDERKPIPQWVRNNANWWSEGKITDTEFIQGIQYLIKNGIIEIPQTSKASTTIDHIPDWVKSNAEWWGKGQIADDEFVNSLQYLISKGIIKI